jgi:beta-1,2-mannobiose phosphorylase / 1,2-beta-oligomannan phosphorylase
MNSDQLQATTVSNRSSPTSSQRPRNFSKPRKFYSSLDRAFAKRRKQLNNWLAGAKSKKKDKHPHIHKRVRMTKAFNNPIIRPVEHHSWESLQTFNAAACYADGKVHFFYRALGDDYISRIGYATSIDGVTIHKRLKYPIYNIITHYDEDPEVLRHRYDAADTYASGGGWAGCEDPRVTFIDETNTLFMFYVAFDGYNMPRVAMTSISMDDILTHDWNWKPAQIISPPGVIDKSGVLFPEKIKGKYVIMHRIFPDILIDFVDTLEFPKGTYLKGEHRIRIRPDHWDSRKIGAGAPPLKTKHGWLLIYYGVDDRNASQYKMGAMLLDHDDPRKVLYRTNAPIVEPTNWYENEGHKTGIVYPCGAVIKDDSLYVYYGGADTVVCVAYAELDTFIYQLMHHKRPVLKEMAGRVASVFKTVRIPGKRMLTKKPPIS